MDGVAQGEHAQHEAADKVGDACENGVNVAVQVGRRGGGGVLPREVGFPASDAEQGRVQDAENEREGRFHSRVHVS